MTESEALNILKREGQPKREVRKAIQLAERIAGHRLTETDAWRLLENRRSEFVRPIVAREVARLEREFS